MSDLVHYQPPDRPISSLELAPQAWKLAEKIAATDFVPKALRGKPEAVLACMLAGHEAGISPMQALSKIHIIDGRPAMAAELMRALVMQHGHELWYEEVSTTSVTACGKRRGSDRTTKVVWTMDDAKRGNLTGKDNWRHWPRAMLIARATAELCRMMFPDVLAGISYTVEELEDGGAAAGLVDFGPPEVAELPAAAAAPPTTTAQAARRATRDTAAATVETKPPAPSGEIPDLPDAPPPAAPADPEEDWPSGDWPTDNPPIEQTRRYTGPQLIAIKLGERFDIRGNTADARAARLDAIGRLIGRLIGSSKDLSPDEVTHLCAVLDNWPEGEPLPDPPSAPAADTEIAPDPAPIPPTAAADTETPPPPPETAQAPVAPVPRRPAGPDAWSGDEWRDFLAKRKVKVTETMKEAQRLAALLPTPVTIATLDDVAGSGIETDLVGWAEDLSLERRTK